MEENKTIPSPAPDDELRSLWKRKIAGYYANDEQADAAVDRMLQQRDEIRCLLLSTHRAGTDKVLQFLDESGFYYRPSSASSHHNWPGGLAEHSLGVCHNMLSDRIAQEQDRASLVIIGLLHDICKADRFYFDQGTIRQHSDTETGRQGGRSVRFITTCGMPLSPEETLAIRCHMHTPNSHFADGVDMMLWYIVTHADRRDSKERGQNAPGAQTT